MKVLLVSPAADFGGAERCLLDCVDALVRSDRSIEVEVLALTDGPLLERVRALGGRTLVLEPPSELAEAGESAGPFLEGLGGIARVTPAVVKFLTAFRAALVRARPDVVHTNGMKAHLLVGLLAPLRTRLIVHLHDFIGARRASRWLIPALAQFRRDAVFVANSRAVASDFSRLAPGAKIRTIYNVVDVDYFSPGPPAHQWLATLSGLPPPEADEVRFGLVATYASWKGHELFIEAAGQLRLQYPGQALRFYVVGGPIYKTRGSQVEVRDLQRWAAAAGVTDCLGIVPFQEDTPRVYRSLNVVVHASTKPEPFGRTIVEAMACARTTIVAQGGGAAELFQHDRNALGFSPNSRAELVAAMSHALNPTTRARLEPAARSHAVERFGSARLSGELLAAYIDAP